MKCRKCGHKIPDKLLKKNSFECPACGKVYRRKNADSSEVVHFSAKKRSKKKKGIIVWIKRIIMIPLCLFVGLVILALVLPGEDTTPDNTKKQATPVETSISATETPTPSPTAFIPATEEPTSIPTQAVTIEPTAEIPEISADSITPEITVPAIAAEIPQAQPATITTNTQTKAASSPTEEAEIDITTKVLKKGDSGEYVVILQKKLKSLGFLSGSADGEFGQATENAIKAYQKAAGLPITGIFDYNTYLSMKSPNAPKIQAKKSSSSSGAKVWIASSGEKYHRRDCPTLKKSNKKQISRSEAIDRGYTACKVCYH